MSVTAFSPKRNPVRVKTIYFIFSFPGLLINIWNKIFIHSRCSAAILFTLPAYLSALKNACIFQAPREYIFLRWLHYFAAGAKRCEGRGAGNGASPCSLAMNLPWEFGTGRDAQWLHLCLERSPLLSIATLSPSSPITHYSYLFRVDSRIIFSEGGFLLSCHGARVSLLWITI